MEMRQCELTGRYFEETPVTRFKRIVKKSLNFVEDNRRGFEDLVVTVAPRTTNVVHLLIEERKEFLNSIEGRRASTDTILWNNSVTDSLQSWLDNSDKLIDTFIGMQPRPKAFKAVALNNPVEIKFAQIPATSIYHWGVMSVMENEHFDSFCIVNGPKTFTGLLSRFSKKEYPEDLKRKLINFSMKSQVRDDFKNSEIRTVDVGSLLNLIKHDFKCVEMSDVEKYLKKFVKHNAVNKKAHTSTMLSQYVEVLGDRIKDDELKALAGESLRKPFNVVSEAKGESETVLNVDVVNTVWIPNLKLEVRTEKNKRKVLVMGIDKIADSYRLILDVYKQMPNSGIKSYEISEPNHILDYVDKVPVKFVLEPGKTVEDLEKGMKLTIWALNKASQEAKEEMSRTYLKNTKLRSEASLDYVKGVFLERMFDNIDSDKKTAPRFSMR